MSRDLVSRPGISDLICLGVLLLSSVAGAILEPPHREFWLGFPLLMEVPLLCTGLLLLSRSGSAGKVATAIHILILIGSGLCVVFSVFLFVTILFAGLAIILGPFSVIVALNSLYSLSRIRARSAVASASFNTGTHVA